MDENPECLRRAAVLLGEAGIEHRVQTRGQIPLSGTHKYAVSYEVPTLEVVPAGATLLEGDAIRDPTLRQWLNEAGPFDAVVCWMVGTHLARRVGLDAAVDRDATNRPGMYRLQVQNETYSLANEVLHSGGILQIADRGKAPKDESLKLDMIKSHQEQAETTTLTVEGLAYMEVASYQAESGIAIHSTPDLSGRIPASFQPALISVFSRKQ